MKPFVTGNQSVAGNLHVSGQSNTGSVTIGGGTSIAQHLSTTFSPTFPALKPSTCSAVSLTFTGASDGDAVTLGMPNARMGGGGILLYTAWVSSANTITLRVCNIDPNAKQTTVGTGAIRIDLWKH